MASTPRSGSSATIDLTVSDDEGTAPQAKRARTAPSTDVEALSVKEMRAVIKSAGLSSADCFEKSDLRKRTREALARLDEARRLKAQRRATEAPAASPPAPPPAPADAELEACKRRIDACKNGDGDGVLELPPTLSKFQRQQLHMYADSLGGLGHESVGIEPERRLRIYRRAAMPSRESTVPSVWTPAPPATGPLVPINTLQMVRRHKALDHRCDVSVYDFLSDAETQDLLDGLMARRQTGGEGIGVVNPHNEYDQKNFSCGKRIGKWASFCRLWKDRGGRRASATCKQIREVGLRIQQRLGLDEEFDYAVIQSYLPNGKDGIAPHTDSEQEESTPIVGLSLYPNPQHSRPLTMTSGEHFREDRVSYDLDLPNGSIYVLAPPTNEWWKHGIKKRVQPRVSITYRRYIRK